MTESKKLPKEARAQLAYLGEDKHTNELVSRIDAVLAQPVSSHGNAEDLYVSQHVHLNCPSCGGSGHVEDVDQSTMAKKATERFLGWKLPKDFEPDSGIRFDKDDDYFKQYPHEWPSGTNLFTAAQAQEMFEYCLEGITAQPELDAAIKTLEGLGYSYHGGERWKPPLGNPPAWLAQPEREPLFWYRPCKDGLYEGPVHHNSVGGKMLRDEKPDEWKPLYTTPPRRKPLISFSTEYETALAELVDKITNGLDSGNLLADAVVASKAISMWKTPLKDSELLDAFCNTPHGDVHQFISAFISGARFAEWHHSGVRCGKE